VNIRVGAVSDVGRVRGNNEDSYVVRPPLYAVADGMGGVQAGEVASALALDTLEQIQAGDGRGALAEWVRLANHAVYERSQQDQAVSGMGTTLTAILVQGDRFRLAHVGDTRAYLLRNGAFRQLTEDHSLVHRMVMEGTLTEAQAAVHPDRNILTRALGIKDDVSVDETMVAVQNGDRIMLCSDGLHGMVPEDAMQQILMSSADPQQAAQRLVDAANAAGGVDNITAVVLDIDDVSAPRPPATAPAPSARRAGAPSGATFAWAVLAAVAGFVLALILHLAGIPPFDKQTKAEGRNKIKTADPIAGIIRSGATATGVRYGNLDGEATTEFAIASTAAADIGGPFLDVGTLRGGQPHPLMARIDYSEGSGTSGGASGTKPSVSIVFLELVDFRNDSTPEIVVGVTTTSTDSLSMEVHIYSLDEQPQIQCCDLTVQDGTLGVDGKTVVVTSPTSLAGGGPPGMKRQRIGVTAGGAIGVVESSTFHP
jgi:PPM family protein phosphatase